MAASAIRAAPEAAHQLHLVDLQQLLGGGDADRRIGLGILDEQLELAPAEDAAGVIDLPENQLCGLLHVRSIGAGGAEGQHHAERHLGGLGRRRQRGADRGQGAGDDEHWRRVRRGDELVGCSPVEVGEGAG